MSTNGVNQQSNRTSLHGLSEEQLAELRESFNTIDLNGDGEIQFSELQQALHLVGYKLPGYEVRQLIERFSRSGKQSLSLAEFNELYKEFKGKDPNWTKQLSHASNVEQIGGLSEASQAVGVVHTIRYEEQVAFGDWINSNLSSDKDLHHLLPIDKEGKTLYEKVSDGILLCKLINLAVAETIDERTINKKNLSAYTKRENLMLALMSAQSIGCHIVNMDADDLAKGKPHLVLGLMWQIIRIGLLSQIDLHHCPGLVRLLRDGETLADLQKMSPEQILLRWVNYHLEGAGVERRIGNFTEDIKDSEAYTYLLKQIAPMEKGVTLDPLRIHGDNVGRAGAMLREADKLGCKAFVAPNDVANGVYKLNLAFVANLFNTWPGLKPPGEDELQVEGDLSEIEETREEKMYRNWMNSMGVQPYVNWLYSDLSNAIVIFQLYDIIQPGLVDWKKVVSKFHKLRAMMDQIQNCNYAVELGKKVRFSLVGIQGKDIYDGNRTLTLALLWQLMRAYTLTVLAQCRRSGTLATDKEIVEWANRRLKEGGKSTSISSFQDPKIGDAKVVIDLIDVVKPGLINYDVVGDDKLANAKYAISSARKMGAKVYALPEDIVEVKPKMVMTVFACLMTRDTPASNEVVDPAGGD